MKKNEIAKLIRKAGQIFAVVCIVITIGVCGFAQAAETDKETITASGNKADSEAALETDPKENPEEINRDLQAIIEKSAQTGMISPEDAREIIGSDLEFLLLDVREQDEYAEGYIPGAVCISYTELEVRQEELPDDEDLPIIVYCRSGRRSSIAAETLTDLGYRFVLDLGGILDWPYEVVTGEPETETEFTTSAEGKTEVTEKDGEKADHEHSWEDYDCNYRKCSICGKMENHPTGK